MHQRVVAAVAKATEELEAGTKVNVTRLSRSLGMSPKTFYKWAKRYRREGLAGLEERSRRPYRSPHQIRPAVEEAIRRWRKQLDDEGLDAGPGSIHWHLIHDDGLRRPPSEATIWRFLAREGFITPQPQKRPKTACRRFEAAAPNECWQIDACDWVLADGTTVQILNVIDDHSRLWVAGQAVAVATTQAAWDAFSVGVARYGTPAGCLSDNGLIFSGKLRGFEVFFEVQLRAAGIRPITARPFHPQTCGKVERFHQTLKKWLRKRRRQAMTVAALQDQLDQFRDYYNQHRPHRGIGRRTPWQRFTATEAAITATGPLAPPDQHRRINVTVAGLIEHRPWRIKVPRRYARRPADVYLTGTHVTVFIDGRLVRDFELDTSRAYQPLAQ